MVPGRHAGSFLAYSTINNPNQNIGLQGIGLTKPKICYMLPRFYQKAQKKFRNQASQQLRNTQGSRKAAPNTDQATPTPQRPEGTPTTPGSTKGSTAKNHKHKPKQNKPPNTQTTTRQPTARPPAAPHRTTTRPTHNDQRKAPAETVAAIEENPHKTPERTEGQNTSRHRQTQGTTTTNRRRERHA